MDSATAIKIQIRVFRMFGLLPSKDSGIVYSFWTLVIFFIGGISLVISQAISLLFATSINDLIEQLLLFCTTSTVTIKIAIFYLNRDVIFEMLEILRKLDQRLKTHQDIYIMENIYRICSRVSLFFVFLYSGTIASIYFQIPFLDREVLTWKSTSLVPYEFAQDPWVYYSVLASQALGNSLNCGISCAIDTYSTVLILLVTGHTDTLRSQLTGFGSETNKLQLIECLKYYEQLCV